MLYALIEAYLPIVSAFIAAVVLFGIAVLVTWKDK